MSDSALYTHHQYPADTHPYDWFDEPLQAGALIAPDGSVGRLGVPKFDSPSASGSLPDRQAGHGQTMKALLPGGATWHAPVG